MGRQPNEFIPVKYKNQSEESASNIMLNLMIGGLFVAFLYQIYKQRGGKGIGTGQSAGKKTT